mmetsp:Transcript_112108/g.219769  ORF Transcript_112108/g.219769 Transcript_112108/m.219769 type:complete len:205 (+) Transcript_112108:1052-1666(+)
MSACSRFFSSRSTCSMIKVSSRFSKACFSWICARSSSNSFCKACTSVLKSSSKASSLLCWISSSRSTFSKWLRTATWCCSSASSRSRSNICKMASRRSTSLSWFCEMISTCFFNCLVLADRMIFSQLSCSLLMLYFVFFISSSVSLRSFCRCICCRTCCLSYSAMASARARLPVAFRGGIAAEEGRRAPLPQRPSSPKPVRLSN